MGLTTGQGASVVLSVSNFTACFVEIDLGEETIPSVNMSCLDTAVYEQLMPGDLKEPGTITFPFLADTQTAPPALGVVESCTFTLPTAEGEATPATWAGSGFLTRYKRSRFVKNEMIDGDLTFQFDGVTGPTFTPGADV